MHRVVSGPRGRQLHVGGRKRPIVTRDSHPHLFKSVRRYMPGPLPTPPDAFDYFAASRAAQADILGNDQLGDCTAAGACHLVEAFTAAAGTPITLTRTDAVLFYGLSTGYTPSDPSTDQGGDEVTVCTTWRDKGLDGQGAHKIAGWLSVDPSDATLVKTCCWLFEGLYFGIELDSTWTQIAGDGFVWSGGSPNPEDGHCVVGAGADSSGIRINTWGFLGTITYGAIAQFCAESAGGNLFAILSPEIVSRAQAKAPNGLDWGSLASDFAGLGGPSVLV